MVIFNGDSIMHTDEDLIEPLIGKIRTTNTKTCINSHFFVYKFKMYLPNRPAVHIIYIYARTSAKGQKRAKSFIINENDNVRRTTFAKTATKVQRIFE